MTAVAELAAAGKRRDVREGVVERLGGVPELDFAQARRVDDEAAFLTNDELAVHARVAAARVPVPDFASGQQLPTDQPVDDRGLAGAGRTEERDGPTCREKRDKCR